MRRQRSIAILVALVLVVAAAGTYYLGLNPLWDQINKGLDIQGGVHVVYRAVGSEENPVTAEKVAKDMQIIEQRVNGLGVAEPVIQLEGEDRIIVELPGVENPEEAIRTLGRTAKLEFKDPDGNTIVSGADLVKADAEIRPDTGQPVVTLQFNDEGAKKFADATTRLVGKNIAIFLDDQPLSAPVVREPIPNGQAEISGGYATYDEALRDAVALQSGALPIPLEIIENRTVSPTLGADSWAKTENAAVVGLALVLAFMFLYYRTAGLWADFALFVFVLLYLGVLYGIGATLTLPGIAGIVLAIGMAVDANIIIFERIREEVRLGNTLRAAINQGFSLGFRAVLDANATTLIAAAVLFYFGTGPVRGFAVTLAVGVLLSMLTAVVFTRYILRLLVSAGARQTPWFFGVRRAAE